jgi:hypothetical protein
MESRSSYRIPDRNLPGLIEKLEKLNRRAARLGVEPITLTETGEAFELHAQDSFTTRVQQVEMLPGETLRSAEARFRDANQQSHFHFFPRRFVLVDVAGEAPRVNGWAFAAVLQHLEGGNVLAYVPGWEARVPATYREAAPSCDHCHADRQRKDTYVVANEAGDWKQVGRSCLKDFTGHQDPQALASWAETLASFANSCSAAEEFDDVGGCRSSKWLSMSSFLEASAWAIRTQGWVSRKQAKDSYLPIICTADIAMILMRPNNKSERDTDLCKEYDNDPMKAEDVRVATEARAWAETLEPKVDDDYLWNLRVLANSDAIEDRQTGLAASMISAYCRATERELNRRREAEAGKASEHVGTVGQRIEMDVTLISTKHFDSEWGGSDLLVFVDSAGNRIKWWASGSCGWAPALGATYHVKATVKEHGEYNSVRETICNRMAEFDPQAAAEAKIAAKAAAKERAKAKRAAPALGATASPMDALAGTQHPQELEILAVRAFGEVLDAIQQRSTFGLEH